jgi:hypothetical protein
MIFWLSLASKWQDYRNMFAPSSASNEINIAAAFSWQSPSSKYRLSAQKAVVDAHVLLVFPLPPKPILKLWMSVLSSASNAISIADAAFSVQSLASKYQLCVQNQSGRPHVLLVFSLAPKWNDDRNMFKPSPASKRHIYRRAANTTLFG